MAVKITSGKKLESWLRGKPREWAQLIALRAALRVVPFALDFNLRMTKSIFHVMVVSSTGAKFTADDTVRRAAYAAVDAAANASNAANAAYAAATSAADAAAYAAANAAVDAAYAAADTATYAANAAANAYAAAHIWVSIKRDCQSLEDGMPLEKVHQSPLWIEAPQWWEERWNAARKWLSLRDHGFEIWREWYYGRLKGLPHAFADFDDEADEKFYRWIVEQDDKWWSREPAEVNAEIAEFVDALRKPKDEPPVDFFVSHASGDKAALSDLLRVLDDMGKTYIVPVRDGSEARSDKAIERADKVIALYSENYFQSKQCEDEWLHAYMLDVNTAEQRMLAFRLDRADLKPLMNGLSFCDLTRLLPDRRKQAIAKWIEWKPRPHIRDNVEQTLTTHLDPGVVASDDGKLDTAPDAALNTAELPSQLAQAMEALRMMLDLARQTERNLSSMMQGTLKLYDDHFTENGRDSSWRGLDRYIKVLSEGAADLSAATMREEKAALEQLIAAHGECIDALASADEQNRELANIPVPNDDPGTIGSLIDQLSDVQEQAHDLEVSTEKYDSEARGLVAQGRDFAFEAGAPDAAQKPDAARKSFLRYVGGFGMKTLTVLGSLATLRSTPEGKKLIEAAKSLVEEFYKMIGL